MNIFTGKEKHLQANVTDTVTLEQKQGRSTER